MKVKEKLDSRQVTVLRLPYRKYLIVETQWQNYSNPLNGETDDDQRVTDFKSTSS
jgi:hypothetical protein